MAQKEVKSMAPCRKFGEFLLEDIDDCANINLTTPIRKVMAALAKLEYGKLITTNRLGQLAGYNSVRPISAVASIPMLQPYRVKVRPCYTVWGNPKTVAAMKKKMGTTKEAI